MSAEIGVRFQGTGRSPLVLRALHDAVIESPDWQDYGLCRQTDADLWFPPPGGEHVKPAMALCKQCPVMDECREYAITNREWWGVWGATTERQRRKLFPRDEAAA